MERKKSPISGRLFPIFVFFSRLISAKKCVEDAVNNLWRNSCPEFGDKISQFAGVSGSCDEVCRYRCKFIDKNLFKKSLKRLASFVDRVKKKVRGASKPDHPRCTNCAVRLIQITPSNTLEKQQKRPLSHELWITSREEPNPRPVLFH